VRSSQTAATSTAGRDRQTHEHAPIEEKRPAAEEEDPDRGDDQEPTAAEREAK
jgi:hypothetical protein